MSAQLNQLPADASAVNPRIPAGVSAAIMRAIAKDPAMRFQKARDFQAALRSSEETTILMPSQAAPPTTAIQTPELADLETRLSRAIGPIAKALVSDAARRYGSIEEIRQALASQIEDPKERDSFIKTSSRFKTGPAAGATTSRTGNSAGNPPEPASVSLDPVALERLTQALAPYIGPIAKVVVTRAARGARSMEEVRNAAAAEIDNHGDRQRFLEATRAIS